MAVTVGELIDKLGQFPRDSKVVASVEVSPGEYASEDITRIYPETDEDSPVVVLEASSEDW